VISAWYSKVVLQQPFTGYYQGLLCYKGTCAVYASDFPDTSYNFPFYPSDLTEIMKWH